MTKAKLEKKMDSDFIYATGPKTGSHQLFYAICIIAAIAVGFFVTHDRRSQGSRVRTRRVLYYVDPMHPAYKSDRPGIAPDCGMALEPVYADEDAYRAALSRPTKIEPERINIASEKQQLLGIRVAAVTRGSGNRTIRILGRVAADETRVYRINVGVDGFVKETHDDAVGTQVKKDQRLAVIYSPEFLSAMAGYVSAIERPQVGVVKDMATGVQNWADRLHNLGMSGAQIKELSLTKNITNDVYVVSPTNGFILSRNISPGQTFERHMEFYRIADLSHVWILADLLGSEARYFHPGGVARITLPNQTGSILARVSRVLPQIDLSTRTLKLRLEADNQTFALRPDMFVDVDLRVPVPHGLNVPADAVLDSGLSKRVFVATGKGFFEPREVETGEHFGDRVQIVKGLAEGEKVVIDGAFLVDSESRLKTAAAAATPHE
jgi:membrane fusion protein, copper/silver efflux system